jgi:anti-sigma B factor antagonist
MELLTKTIAFPESLDDDSIVKFHRDVKGITASDTTVILVDFENVEFMSSTGLMALVVAFKRVREANKKLLLHSVNEQIKMLFELTGMDQIFEVMENPVEVEDDVKVLMVAN